MQLTKELSDERKSVLRKESRNSFISFCEAVKDGYKAEWFHERIAETLQEAFFKLQKGTSSNIIVEMPPQNGKSQLVTVLFPAWALGLEPSWNLITASYSSDLAVKFGRDTRDIMESERYKALFGTRIREDVRARGAWLTPQGGGYKSTGVQGGATGFGYKIGIIDDPFKGREEADSRLIRDNLWDFYNSVFATRKQGATLVVVVNTRWHNDDLVARLEKQEEENEKAGKKDYDKWDYLTFKAIAEEDELPYRKKGEALWPDKFPLSFLKQAEARSAFEFASLYQQNPITKLSQKFHREKFRYFNDNDIKFQTLDKWTLIDPAISDKETADNWVVLTIGKTRNSPNIYRLEETAGRGEPDKMLKAIFYHQGKYNSQVWVETTGFQKILKRDIKEMQKMNQQYFQIHELKHHKHKTKYGRIEALIPLYNLGLIFHKKDDDKEYENELIDFPLGERDDRIDCQSFMHEALFERSTDYDEPEPPTRRVLIDPYDSVSDYRGQKTTLTIDPYD